MCPPSLKIRLLALKCLGFLLKFPLDSAALGRQAQRLGKGLLKLLVWASSKGVGLGEHELVQVGRFIF